MNKVWRASAPSNIALIKYMGKTEAPAGRAGSGENMNRPANRSLSFTLEGLRTHVELESVGAGEDRWEPLAGPGLTKIELSEKARARFLAHLARVKKTWDFSGSFLVRSANDFPADCGLASSASSFAALTKAACDALAELTKRPAMSARAMAELSRQGSGSSCRSLFTPWSLWDADGAREIELPYPDLAHQVVIVEDGRKAVSSSEAHMRVATSVLFRGRPERAEERLSALARALESGDWREARQLVWAEFWDMHALFETARPAFGYMTSGSLEVLQFVRERLWTDAETGPLVTMDAGANVHLLYRSGDEVSRAAVRERFSARYKLIESSASGRVNG